MVFTPALLSRAVHASNGEYAFTRDDLPMALAELGAAGYAVLGGEVWLAEARGPSLIQGADGSFGVYSWTTESQRRGESWAAYVSRCVGESLKAAAGLTPEADLPVDRRASVRFNLTYEAPA
jgi:hypothetical protein